MTIYDLKPAFQNLLRPTCKALAAAGITANQVTLAAVSVSVIVGGLFTAYPTARWAALLLPVWLFLRMALNAIDGMLAREHDMQSSLGGILNELGDVVSDTALYLPFAFVPGISSNIVVAVVILAIFTEMAGIVAIQVGASRRYDGPLGKSDRAFVFGLLALLLGIGVGPGEWANLLLTLVALAALVTVFNRCRKALAELREGHAGPPA
jgi:CDP-diacylglycerol--glycerol-3-phosphate 3-phosphatidyltransferase